MRLKVWQIKAEQVYLSRDGAPTDRTYWLIVARNVQTQEIKYFVSNAPPKTPVATLMQVAFTRAGVEHVFRLAKSEIGLDHFEGRSYRALSRHMILCQLVMLFVAEQTTRLRGGEIRRSRWSKPCGSSTSCADAGRSVAASVRELSRSHPPFNTIKPTTKPPKTHAFVWFTNGRSAVVLKCPTSAAERGFPLAFRPRFSYNSTLDFEPVFQGRT